MWGFNRGKFPLSVLRTWDVPLPWKDEHHSQVSIATDASNTGWGGSLISPISPDVSDYWSREEYSWDISTKEAVAIESAASFPGSPVSVDNQSVI